MSEKVTLVCLMGPTASGKTQLAIDLVQRYPFSIISVDSAMVYRGMDIGTAKPTADILKIAPHRLIDIRDPGEPYSAAHFRADALKEIQDILAQNKIPLLVGGTMLYFKALQAGLSELPSGDPFVRAQLNAEAEEKGWDVLHQRLQQCDPMAAARIHPNDTQRIQRALEVYELTGKSITTWHEADHGGNNLFHIVNIAVAPPDRSILHERIATRFNNMLEKGLIDEVQRLFARRDLNLTLPSIRSVGYRQVWEYLLNQVTYEEMKEKGVIATRQLAKRQLTWLRSWSEVHWFDSEDRAIFSEIEKWL